METVLVHLHPDFSEELDDVFRKWNSAQDVLFFRGITPPKKLEAKLMTGGAIPLEETFEIAKEIRTSCGYAPADVIMVFTEKRIFTSQYHQLFFGGKGKITTISLDFPRKLFSQSQDEQTYLFRALLNNILNALCQKAGLRTHEETLGCVLDFCNDMPDIIKGIEGGPRFCDEHLQQVTQQDKGYLLALVRATANAPEIAEQDAEISRRIAAFGRPVDVGMVIALEEEFREVFSLIRGRAKPIFNQEINQYFYLFEAGVTSPYSCAVTFMGGMGTEKAALVGDRLIHQFKPATIVNIGIAGSMDKDLHLGDIVIAEQADMYLYAAKATESHTDNAFELQLSGDPYRSSPDYVSHARNFEFAYPGPAENWFKSCTSRLEDLLEQDVRHQLSLKNLIRECPKIHIGSIASGPIVGAAAAFVKWLKEHRDRKYLALEMESAGVLSAAHTRDTPTLVIRGISDYGDSRKGELDQIDGGVLNVML